MFLTERNIDFVLKGFILINQALHCNFFYLTMQIIMEKNHFLLYAHQFKMASFQHS